MQNAPIPSAHSLIYRNGQKEITLDRWIFDLEQSRVISVLSWYLTSLINLSFCEISGAFGANLVRTLGGRIIEGKAHC